MSKRNKEVSVQKVEVEKQDKDTPWGLKVSKRTQRRLALLYRMFRAQQACYGR